MDEKAAAYQSYLLRVWRADNDGRPVWRFTLQSTGGGPPKIFYDPDELLTFLTGAFLTINLS
jgi:hypothetical protein